MLGDNDIIFFIDFSRNFNCFIYCLNFIIGYAPYLAPYSMDKMKKTLFYQSVLTVKFHKSYPYKQLDDCPL